MTHKLAKPTASALSPAARTAGPMSASWLPGQSYQGN
jgi:hypothetical protein